MMRKIVFLALLLLIAGFVSCGGECSGDFPISHAGNCWSKPSSDEMDWYLAVQHCTAMGGRLPEIQELRTVIRECPETQYPKPDGQEEWCEIEHGVYFNSSKSEACDGCSENTSGKYSAFDSSEFFWAVSTNDDRYFYRAPGVNFGSGSVTQNIITDNGYAICVKKGEESTDSCKVGSVRDCIDYDSFESCNEDGEWEKISLFHKGLSWSCTRGGGNLVDYCSKIGGRLPTINELRMLVQHCPKLEYPKPEGQSEWCQVVDPDNLSRSDKSSACLCGIEADVDTALNISVFRDYGVFVSSSIEESDDVVSSYGEWEMYYAWRLAEISCDGVPPEGGEYFIRCVK